MIATTPAPAGYAERSDPAGLSDGFSGVNELAGVCEIIRRHGFDVGYHQAVADQLAALVPMVEGYLRRTEASAEQRRYVYGLVSQLEAALLRGSPLVSEGFISGEGI